MECERNCTIETASKIRYEKWCVRYAVFDENAGFFFSLCSHSSSEIVFMRRRAVKLSHWWRSMSNLTWHISRCNILPPVDPIGSKWKPYNDKKGQHWLMMRNTRKAKLLSMDQLHWSNDPTNVRSVATQTAFTPCMQATAHWKKKVLWRFPIAELRSVLLSCCTVDEHWTYVCVDGIGDEARMKRESFI